MLKNNGWVNNVVRDVNPNSNTYLTIVAQRVFDPSICPIPSTDPDWMLLGEYCSGDDKVSTYRDNNPLSPTYMEMRQDIIEGGCAEPEKTEYIFPYTQLYTYIGDGIVWAKWLRGMWGNYANVYVGYYKDRSKEGSSDALSKDDIVANEVDFDRKDRWQMNQFTDTTRTFYVFCSVEADDEEEAQRLFYSIRDNAQLDIQQYANYDDESHPRFEIYFQNRINYFEDYTYELPQRTRKYALSSIGDGVDLPHIREYSGMYATLKYQFGRYGYTTLLNNEARNSSWQIPTTSQPSTATVTVGLSNLPIDDPADAEAFYNDWIADKQWVVYDNYDTQNLEVELRMKQD